MSPRIFTFILYTFIHLKSLKPFFRHNVKVMQSPQIADFTPPLWATARSVADSSSECFDPSVGWSESLPLTRKKNAKETQVSDALALGLFIAVTWRWAHLVAAKPASVSGFLRQVDLIAHGKSHWKSTCIDQIWPGCWFLSKQVQKSKKYEVANGRSPPNLMDDHGWPYWSLPYFGSNFPISRQTHYITLPSANQTWRAGKSIIYIVQWFFHVLIHSVWAFPLFLITREYVCQMKVS